MMAEALHSSIEASINNISESLRIFIMMDNEDIIQSEFSCLQS